MPFQTKTVMDQRKEFVLLASKTGVNLSELCRRFGISRKTGYKWLYRYEQSGTEGLTDMSRRPHSSPGRMNVELENHIVDLRKENPEWGAKKLRRLLQDEQQLVVPAKSTVAGVLKRNGLVEKRKSEQAKSWQRFEYSYPNALWQMDFKGHFDLLDRSRCHPLTILDDHSRFNLALNACKNQQRQTVQQHLIQVFRRYGLPELLLSDNGSPWGTAGQRQELFRSYSNLEKWLIRLNIKPIHGRAYHPQTQGKEERFHRTLKSELLQYEQFQDMSHCQRRFDAWRDRYNCYRPHEAIGLDAPIKRYEVSLRTFPESLPQIEYDESDQVRKVMDKGVISFKNQVFKVGKAFIGDHIALKPTLEDGIWEVYYCNERIRTINLK